MITIKDFTYDVPDTIAPGTEITVINKDTVAHTVTADEDSKGSFDVEIDKGSSATFTAPDQGGEYPFFCRFHPYMTDTLVIG